MWTKHPPGSSRLDPLRPLREWRTNRRDGSLLRLIPFGPFVMGSTAAELESARAMDRDGAVFALGHETPRISPALPAFYIGAYAVTNRQFARFLTLRRPSPPEFLRWMPTPEHIRPPASSGGRYEVDSGYGQHPAIHVSWPGAVAYCEWAGLRLPTEMEWEKAARGTEGRIFPWGDDWDDGRLRWHGGDRPEGETTAPVDAYPGGRSPYGLFQMAGNVEEWCQDSYRPGAYRQYAEGSLAVPSTGYGRVVRGGTCLRRHRLEFRCAMRRGNDPDLVNILFTGLRCACDAPAA